MGGTTSAIGGGKFANGAVSGALATLYTEYASAEKLAEGRALTRAEREFIEKNFKGVYDFDFDRVRIVEGKYAFWQPDKTIMAPNGNIYWPSGIGGGCSDFVTQCSGLTGTFVHEMTHVGQYQSGMNVALRGALLRVPSGDHSGHGAS